MKKYLSLLLIFVSIVGTAAAQTITIKGKVVSSDDKQPLAGAIIRLNETDSTKRSNPAFSTVTNSKGEFTMVSREKKSNISINFMGYEKLTKDIATGKTIVDLGTMNLKLDAISLQGIVVTGQEPMAVIKGDTTEYRASNFKTNPDATAEDLIAKMPGVSKDTDGKLTSQGEKIGRVLLNGKEYFDSDPSLALKSLPSDAVQSIQMFDDQTENARFSGFDDGDRVRTINIVTKAGVNKSVFGRAFAGGGSEDRNIAGTSMNIFNNDHKWTIMAQTHNIGGYAGSFGESNFRGGGGGRGMRIEGADVGTFQTSANGGKDRSSVLALNYSGTMSEKFKMNGSYRYGNRDGLSERFSTQDFLTMPRYVVSNTGANSVTNSHDFSMEGTWTPTPKNRITFRPSVSYSLNDGESFSISKTTAGQEGSGINAADNKYNTKYESFSGNIGLWWQHAYSKPGRTSNIGGNITGNRGMGDRNQYSLYETLGKLQNMELDSINRIGMLVGSGYTLSGSATFNEQLTQYSKLAANYSISYNNTFADQQGWNWEELEQQYSLLDIATTNRLNRNYTSQTIGMGYNFAKDKKINLNLNADYLFASQNNNQTQPTLGTNNSKYNFQAFQPKVSLRYTPQHGKIIVVNAGMSSSFPSITQLQDVLDVSNPLSASKGNPDLKQSYTTSMMLRYISTDVPRNRNFSIATRLSQTNGSFIRNSQFLQQDTIINGTPLKAKSQYTTYENADGVQNAMVFANYSFAVKPIKSIINTGVNYIYSRNPSIQDNVKYITTNNMFGMTLAVVSNINENVDFTVEYAPRLTIGAVGTDRFDRTFRHDLTGRANIYLTRRLFVNADANWRNQYGSQTSATNHYTLINAAIGYKFLSNRQAELKLQAYDLLNQNKSFNQSISETYISTSTNYTLLKQFFLVSVMYKFDTRKSKNANNDNIEPTDGGQRRFEGRPGGGHGGGMGGRMIGPMESGGNMITVQ